MAKLLNMPAVLVVLLGVVKLVIKLGIIDMQFIRVNPYNRTLLPAISVLFHVEQTAFQLTVFLMHFLHLPYILTSLDHLVIKLVP